MMRRVAISGVLCLALAACGNAADQSSAPSTTASPPETSASAAPTTTTTTTPPPPMWEGYAATAAEEPTLVAYTHGPLDVFESPGATEPMVTLEPATILGTVTVLGVATSPSDGWTEVMLPIRPNGTTGWIPADEVSYYIADSRIVVDLTARELKYLVDGAEVLQTEVGVGSVHNQTPPGLFFVTDSVTLANPNSPWGPHALGLSARSDSITEFNGGDGIIGIHGTNNPSSIGGNISLGCVRLPNDVITALHELVPIGTLVEVRA